MPEGDTVLVAAARLHAALAGERLLATDFRVPRFATRIPHKGGILM
jgi:endonuclease VIII